MKPSTVVKLFAIAITTSAIIAANSASAQPRMQISNPGQQQMLLHPGMHPQLRPEAPRLGFSGYTTHQGLVVTRVTPGTEASRVGLERGDTIVNVNGTRIQREGDLERALLRTPPHGAVQLQVRDVRGQGVFLVRAFLNTPPERHYLQTPNHRPVVQYRSFGN